MKRIDILLCLELFNIRNQKKYPKQVIKDSYSVVRNLCCRKYSNGLFSKPITNFKEFKEELRSYYLQKSFLEYKYCQELLDYMSDFEGVVVDLF